MQIKGRGGMLEHASGYFVRPIIKRGPGWKVNIPSSESMVIVSAWRNMLYRDCYTY